MAFPSRSTLKVAGLGLDAAHIGLIADAVGLPIAGADPASDSLALIFDHARHSLADALANPPVACIEWANQDVAAVGHALAMLSPDHPTRAMLLSVTTLTAARHAVARVFTEALVRVAPPEIMTAGLAEFCITELVTNAIIHGNLAIGQRRYSDVAGLDDFAADVETRLADPTFAAKRLLVHAQWPDGRLEVAVADQGNGFELPEEMPEVAPDLSTGRGLSLIRSLGVSLRSENGGRRICLTFA